MENKHNYINIMYKQDTENCEDLKLQEMNIKHSEGRYEEPNEQIYI